MEKLDRLRDVAGDTLVNLLASGAAAQTQLPHRELLVTRPAPPPLWAGHMGLAPGKPGQPVRCCAAPPD